MTITYPQALTLKQIKAREIEGHSSQTSGDLHREVYSLLMQCKSEGCGIIELGSFSGGSSVVFGHISSELGCPFYMVELNKRFAELTERVLEHVGDTSNRSMIIGNLGKLVSEVNFVRRPLLIFIDASHDYPDVVQDIKWLMQIVPRPKFALFHDFSLRSTNPAHGNIRVDRAIYDSFGSDVSLRLMGADLGPDPQWTEKNPSPSGSYWEQHGREAALIDLDTV